LFKELRTQKYLDFAELKGRKYRINNKPERKKMSMINRKHIENRNVNVI